MKRLLFYVAALAIAVGCSQETIDELTTPGAVSDQTTFVTFNLTQQEQSDTRLSVTPGESSDDPWTTDWSQGDYICVYSLDNGAAKYLSVTIDQSGEATFSGEVYTGKNRVLYTRTQSCSTESGKIVVDLTPYNYTDALSDYSMISSEVIEVEGDDASATEEIYVAMQNLASAIDLQIEFTGVPDGLTIKMDSLKFGGKPSSGDGSYVDIVAKVLIDAQKGVDEDGFSQNSTLLSTATPLQISESVEVTSSSATFSAPIFLAPFTMAADQMIYTELIFSFGGVSYSKEFPITNTTGAEFSFARATHSYIKKSFDMSYLFEGSWLGAVEVFDNSGGGSEASPIEISTEGELAYLAAITNGLISGETTKGKYYKLVAELDLSGREWIPIGNDYEVAFQGNFDGNNKSISNLTITSKADDSGLFGNTIGANISNVALSKPSISGWLYVGGVVAYCDDSTVSSCSSVDGTLSGYANIGGVVGASLGSTVTGCSGVNNSLSGYGNIGGVVGNADSSTVIDCFNTDSSVEGSDSNIGGVVGYTNSSSTVSSCYNTGSVEGAGDCIGGVIGFNYSSSVIGCYNTGDIKGAGSCVGGVVGNNYKSSTTTSYNSGSIEGSSYVGGVAGWSGNASSTVSSCYNTGSVKGTGDNVGGVAGYNNTFVTTCYNTGSIEGSSNVGGVVGGNYYSTATSCYNTGSVVGLSNVGGAVGYNEDGTITVCYYISFSAIGDYGTKLISTSSLNDKVDEMNTAAGDDYYTVGSPANQYLPSLMGEVIEFTLMDSDIESLEEGDTLNDNN
ncbi:MAG: GLUG motif-containing protein [Rikenellaceae bacterium]